MEDQAEKMRRQKEYANVICEQNKKINKKSFIPTKELKDNEKEVRRMKVAQLNRGENQQDLSFSLSHLPEQLQVPEMRAELRDSQTSLSATSAQPLVHTRISRHLTQQEDNQLFLQDQEHIPTGRSAVIPATYEVLPPTVGPLRGTDADQNPNTASDGYLVWMKKKQQSLIQSAIKAEKMRRQKENAKVICEQNKKINEKAFVPTKESKDKKEVPRMKDAQLNRGENQQDLSFSLYHLPKQLQVPEMRAELKDTQTSLSTTSAQPLVHTRISRHLTQQEDNQLFLQDQERSPTGRSAAIPAKYEVLPPTEGPLRRMDAEQIPNTASDGHLVQVGNEQQFNTSKVQEQNKKIKKRPFKATTKPKNKDVPRMKTLEFVKTFGKPMEGLDVSRLSRLDFLIKQHIEEKRTIALLFK
ncbi:uncharacterized protein [Takifugu rubripes]|uniref:uncharacterized protein n=1 Tax=Takifugu rubripes TaxID=31033 RepID=UPI001145DD82|nr:uncharacterized protein LOC115249525 [Takifugu rubripes]